MICHVSVMKMRVQCGHFVWAGGHSIPALKVNSHIDHLLLLRYHMEGCMCLLIISRLANNYLFAHSVSSPLFILLAAVQVNISVISSNLIDYIIFALSSIFVVVDQE